MSERLVNAATEVKKALKWIIISGAGTTALAAIYTALEDWQSGVMDWRGFLSKVAFILAFMLLNTAIYFIHEYSK